MPTLPALGPIVASAIIELASMIAGVVPDTVRPATATCPKATGSRVALSSAPIAKTTTTAIVRVCLSVPARQTVGSLRASIVFDSAVARVTAAKPPKPGAVAVNTSRAGRVELAIASPSGVAAGELLSITLKLVTPGRLPAMRLDLAEISDGKGVSLAQQTQVASLGRAECVERAESSVRVTSLSPTIAEAGAITEVTISGCGFEPTNNTVTFGSIVMARLPSTDGGSRIRITVPTEYRSRSEVPPEVISVGSYPIVVKTIRGSSNALVFTLR